MAICAAIPATYFALSLMEFCTRWLFRRLDQLFSQRDPQLWVTFAMLPVATGISGGLIATGITFVFDPGEDPASKRLNGLLLIFAGLVAALIFAVGLLLASESKDLSLSVRVSLALRGQESISEVLDEAIVAQERIADRSSARLRKRLRMLFIGTTLCGITACILLYISFRGIVSLVPFIVFQAFWLLGVISWRAVRRNSAEKERKAIQGWIVKLETAERNQQPVREPTSTSTKRSFRRWLTSK